MIKFSVNIKKWWFFSSSLLEIQGIGPQKVELLKNGGITNLKNLI